MEYTSKWPGGKYRGEEKKHSLKGMLWSYFTRISRIGSFYLSKRSIQGSKKHLHKFRNVFLDKILYLSSCQAILWSFEKKLVKDKCLKQERMP